MCIWTIISAVSDALIMIISSFAIIQFFLNKAQRRKTAATIVYNQLKNFDEVITRIKGLVDDTGNVPEYYLSTLPSVLETNYWNDNKHILISKLSEDDIDVIENTYATIENLENARKWIIDTQKDTNLAKSTALQFQLSQMVLNNQASDITQFSKLFRNVGEGFSIRFPHDVFRNMIGAYTKVSGTVTMEKLKNLSYKTKA